MNQDPALTPERIDALNAVDLRLFGVTHGFPETVDGVTRVKGGDDADFDGLLAATNELHAEHGDALAIEPTGFMSSFAEELTLANVVPANIPEIPVADMPPELQTEIVALLERGRKELRLNKFGIRCSAYVTERRTSAPGRRFSTGVGSSRKNTTRTSPKRRSKGDRDFLPQYQDARTTGRHRHRYGSGTYRS